MYIVYRYVFQIGQNEHRIELHENYTEEFGLSRDEIYVNTSTRKDTLFKELYSKFDVTDSQKETLEKVAKERPLFIIIAPNGKVYNK